MAASVNCPHIPHRNQAASQQDLVGLLLAVDADIAAEYSCHNSCPASLIGRRNGRERSALHNGIEANSALSEYIWVG